MAFNPVNRERLAATRSPFPIGFKLRKERSNLRNGRTIRKEAKGNSERKEEEGLEGRPTNKTKQGKRD